MVGLLQSMYEFLFRYFEMKIKGYVIGNFIDFDFVGFRWCFVC